MMNFLPQIYEDELLYSVIARYRRMCGMISKAALLRDLYHEKRVLTSIFIPEYIKDLVSNFPPRSKLSVNDIIINHTMFPFFMAFINESLANGIYNAMENGGTIGVSNLLGFTGGKVKVSNYLRYCPLCYQEDMQKLGESYWRRLFQVPGVLYCLKHEVLLKESTVLSTADKMDYYCADEDTCTDHIREDLNSKKFTELNLQYIQNVIKLIKGEFPRRDLPDIVQFYIDALRKRGYASSRGYIYMKKFVTEFIEFYPQSYLQIMQSPVDNEQNGKWLRLFVRDNGKNRSPLRHLLVLQFLNISVEEVFETKVLTGKISIDESHIPKFSLEERRKQWLKIIESHPGANRSELKRIGKGLHTWIYRHDQEWYEQVTPRFTTRKKKRSVVDWEARDENCLSLTKQAVESLMAHEGKPIRVTPSSIRREIGVRRWMDNPKLIKTQQYIKEITEEIDSFRERKIKWAIQELQKNGEYLTVYKIQLYGGFGGDNQSAKDVRNMIEEILARLQL